MAEVADLRRKLTQESTKKEKLVQDLEVGGWVLSNHGDMVTVISSYSSQFAAHRRA